MTDWTFPVEAGQIIQFCRSLGEPDPVPDPSGELLAPPTFLAAAEHYRADSNLRPRPGVAWRGSGGRQGESSPGGGSLHAEQQYEYHRPVRAGMRLTVCDRGVREWEKTGRRALLRFTERTTDYLDADGAAVVTERRITVVSLPAAAPS